MAFTTDGWRRRNGGASSMHGGGGSVSSTSPRGSPQNKQLPDVYRRTFTGVSNSATPRVTFVTGWQTHRIDVSPSLPDVRRLPQLGQPLQGCWSSPNLDKGRRSRPLSGVASGDAATVIPGASTFATAAAGSLQKAMPTMDQSKWKAANRASVSSVGRNGQRIKNTSVWQRWQVSVPSNRMQREEVLERDRQRQRSACGWDHQRNFASPARSHGASLFFDNVPGGNEVAGFLPGPFRSVARPQTNHCMQRTAAAATSAQQPPGGGGAPAKKTGSKSGPGDDSLRDADLLFDHQEMQDLTNSMDSLAGLIKPPIKEADTLMPPSLAATGDMKDTGKIDMQSINAAREMEKQGPIVLRSLYCRFLLASGLCGKGSSSPFGFHELVSAFDEKSTSFGAFTGMTRTTLCCLIAKILVPPGDAAKRLKDPAAPKDAKLLNFFSTQLPRSTRHCEDRHHRLQLQRQRTPAVEHVEVPAAILEEVTQDSIWPPLPPRGLMSKELPDWMNGVRQWEEELGRQSAARLLALRAHTESVIRGEMIASQLLEPEVLHFATRFRPLFVNLFSAYCDWPDPEQPETKESLPPTFAPSQTTESQEGRAHQHSVGLGHMSFMAFFRFCVDFEIFPSHANFEEICNIYNDAEAVRRLIFADGGTLSDDAGEEPSEAGKHRRGSGCQSETPTERPKNKKVLVAISVASAAAVQTAEQNLPKVDLRFFEKPFALMSPFEIKTVTFFAAVDEWLSERFLRLSDIVKKTNVEEEDARVEGENVHKAASTAALQQLNIDENGEWIPDPESAGKPGAGFRNKEEEERAIKAAVRLAAQATTTALADVVPPLQVNPKGLLEVIAPMKSAYKPQEREVYSMFRLLLAGPDENGQYGVEPPENESKPLSELKAPTIPVFQLDKALRKAQQTLDKARRYSCHLMRTDSERTSSEKVCFSFFEEMYNKMFERSKWQGGYIEDIFADCNELTPEILINKAKELGIPEEQHPSTEDLTTLLIEVVGRREAAMDKRFAYRAIALMMEGKHRQRHKALCVRLQCQTHKNVQEKFLQAEGPKEIVFGLPAFVECLLKLALHRLGFKGLSDIQRGAPAWWKCTWLLTLLNGKFSEHVALQQFDKKMHDLAMEGEGSWDEAFSDTVGVGMTAMRPSTGIYSTNSTLLQKRHYQMSRQDSHSGSSVTENSTEQKGQKGGGSGSKKGRSQHQGRQSRRSQSHLAGDTPRQEGTSASGDDAASSVGERSTATKSHTARSRGHRSTKEDTNRKGKRKITVLDRVDRGPNQDAEIWWRKLQTGRLLGCCTRTEAPMEWLAKEVPDLFETVNAEAQVSPSTSAFTSSGEVCSSCGEKPSSSGWGNPGCVHCGGVESQCLPIESHLFADLLRTYLPDTESVAAEEEEEEEEEAVDEDSVADVEVRDGAASPAKSGGGRSPKSQK